MIIKKGKKNSIKNVLTIDVLRSLGNWECVDDMMLGAGCVVMAKCIDDIA